MAKTTPEEERVFVDCLLGAEFGENKLNKYL